MFDSNVMDAETTHYYNGHLPRFIYQDELFRTLTDIKTVYDLGTWFPFSSHVFAEMGADVKFGCELPPIITGIPNATHILCDFKNPPQLPPADMVMCCECLEHLPYNLIKIRDYLVSLVKPNGYLFLSFPTGSTKKGEWEDELPEIDDKRHTHLREFPVDSARLFCQGTGFDVLSEKCIKTPMYGAGEGIIHILMRSK